MHSDHKILVMSHMGKTMSFIETDWNLIEGVSFRVEKKEEA